MTEGYMTEKEYAELRGVCVRTIQRERIAGKGAPFIKLGRFVCYRRASVDRWLLDQEVSHD